MFTRLHFTEKYTVDGYYCVGPHIKVLFTLYESIVSLLIYGYSHDISDSNNLRADYNLYKTYLCTDKSLYTDTLTLYMCNR